MEESERCRRPCGYRKARHRHRRPAASALEVHVVLSLLAMMRISPCWCIDDDALLPQNCASGHSGYPAGKDGCAGAVSPACHPTPVSTYFTGCEHCDRPECELRVSDDCVSVPQQPNAHSIRFQCSRHGGRPVVNISWELPQESMAVVTAYKINLFNEGYAVHCSLLVPAVPGQAWFLLFEYEELRNCTRSGWTECTVCYDPIPCHDTMLGCLEHVRVTSLPIKQSIFTPSGDNPLVQYGTKTRLSKDDRTLLMNCISDAEGVPLGTCQVYNYNATGMTTPTRPPSTLQPSPTPSPADPAEATLPANAGTSNMPVTYSTSRADSSADREHTAAPPATRTAPAAHRDSGGSREDVLLVVAGALGAGLVLGFVVTVAYTRRNRQRRFQKLPLSTSSLVAGTSTRVPPYLPPPPITPPPITNSRPHVYISYSRCDPHHRRRVRGLADWLHENGIAVVADFYYANEMAVGPQFFVEKGVTSSTFVLAVCSEDYADVWMTDRAEDTSAWAVLQPPSMLTSWEIGLIRVCMSTLARDTPDVIPIVMLRDDEELPHVPDLVPLPLLTRRVYGLGNVATNKDQLDLLQRLHLHGGDLR